MTRLPVVGPCLGLLLGCANAAPSGAPPRPPTTTPPTTAPPSAAPPTSEAPAASLAAPPAAPSRPRGATTFGVNDPITIPKLFIDRGDYPREREPLMLAANAALVVSVGARAVRGSTPVYPYLDHSTLIANNWDWTRPDNWARAVGEAGLEPLLMLGPWPGNKTAGYTDQYVPSDMAAYQAYVRRVVERYDGDGTDDMPGLSVAVKVWEVDNEPDLHNTRPPKGMTSKVEPKDFEKPSEYARVLVATAAAIREADPTAKVASAGFYGSAIVSGQDYMRAVFREPGALAAIDIINVHCYFDTNNLDAIEKSLAIAKEVAPGRPIWVTETSVPSDKRKPWADEAWQARMVAAVYGAYLAGGAERIFWHTLADPPPNPNAPHSSFSTNSLFRRTPPPGGASGSGPRKGGGVEEKPAAQVYKRLAAHMAGLDPSALREEPASGGRLLWTGQGWLAFWGTPQVPSNGGVVEDLLTGTTTAGLSEVVAPAWITPRP
jgi:hypothetical protein